MPHAIRAIAQGLLRVIRSESDCGLYIGMSGGIFRGRAHGNGACDSDALFDLGGGRRGLRVFDPVAGDQCRGVLF